MFNNTNVRFSSTAQVARTVEYLKKNKTTKYTQYTPAFKIKVLDLMLEEEQAAKNGKDTYTCKRGNSKVKRGEFSKYIFYKACGLGPVPLNGKWEDTYNSLDGDATLSANVCAVSRVGLKELHTSAESQGLGDLARETNALIRKTKELTLKHDAKEMGFKLVRVA